MSNDMSKCTYHCGFQTDDFGVMCDHEEKCTLNNSGAQVRLGRLILLIKSAEKDMDKLQQEREFLNEVLDCHSRLAGLEKARLIKEG